MIIIDQPYALLLVFATLIPAVLTASILRHRPNPGALSFSLLMASVSLWAFVALFEVCSRDPHTKIFSYEIKYLFIVTAPVAWLAFCLYYADRIHRRLFTKYLPLLLVIPAVTLLMVATNSFHHLMFSHLELVQTDRHLLVYPHFGPYFWVHVAYSYLLLLAGFILLIKHMIDYPAPHRHQVAALMVGGMAPWVSNVFFIFRIGGLAYFDLTPVAFTVSGIAFMWGILRHKLLDIVPIAREAVLQNMYDGVIVIDKDENIIDMNQAAQRLADADPSVVIGHPAMQIIPWWPAYKRYQWSVEEGHFPILDLIVDGRTHLLQVTQSPIRFKDRRLGHVITLHDVTAAQTAQKALGESEARFKSLSENAPVIIFSLDQSGLLSYVNPAWEKLLGYSRKEVLGRPFADFIRQQNDRKVFAIFEQLIDGRVSVAELNIQIMHRDGSLRLFNTSASANSDTEGRVTGIIGLAKDVTEEHRLQHQLIESQKMEAIGTLAGGIAHDFNNLLMGIQANLSLMRLEAAGAVALKEKIRRIEDQIQNGASLTRQLLGYARKGKYALNVFNLNDMIQEALNVVRRTHKSVVIHQQLSEQPAHLKADQGQIELVLLNLFINAVDAMPDGGELTVRTRLMIKSQGPAKQLRSNHGTYLELQVCDTGIGMDHATQNRIFEPFFTTKEMGRGTGLGLASVYGVIKNHGGSIQVHSSPGQGSKFTVVLPAAQKVDGLCPLNENRDAMPLPTCCANILLVDDEPLILQYCQEMIKSLGYSVITAQDAEAALRIYKDRGQSIDVAVIDLVMPKIGGLQLLETLKALNPQIRVIITTGYALDSRITDVMAGGRHQCLKKPYTRDELASAIAHAMGQASEPVSQVQAEAM
jgi:two-component system, cell cycle sensor histidine kinase and response regulator CckA